MIPEAIHYAKLVYYDIQYKELFDELKITMNFHPWRPSSEKGSEGGGLGGLYVGQGQRFAAVAVHDEGLHGLVELEDGTLHVVEPEERQKMGQRLEKLGPFLRNRRDVSKDGEEEDVEGYLVGKTWEFGGENKGKQEKHSEITFGT